MKTPTAGPIAQSLKSPRKTLQECLEDDTTGRGSGSRLALILGTLTLCVALVFALAAHGFLGRDFNSIIQSLIIAIAGGGAGPYTFKRVMEIFRMRVAAPSAPGVASTGSTSMGCAGDADGGDFNRRPSATETAAGEPR